MSLDLSTLDTATACDAGAEIELRHPVTDSPLGIFITVKGKDSAAFRAQIRQSISARVKRRGAMTPEDNEADGVALLVACTMGWRTKNENEGQPDSKSITFQKIELECTPANATKLYTALPWMRRQVDEGIADLANFLAP